MTANPSENQYCGWTRMTDSQDPFDTKPIRYRIGCEGKVARGKYPILPNVCPHCGKAVEVKSSCQCKELLQENQNLRKALERIMQLASGTSATIAEKALKGYTGAA